MILASGLCPWSPSGATVLGEAKGYRLAGTLAVGTDYIALLQVPGGSQMLLRAGSIVGDAKVLAVNAHEVTLQLPSGVIELSLEGTVRPLTKAASAAVVSKADGPEAGIYTRKVNEEQLSRELASSSATRAQGAVPSTPGIVAAQRITAVLDLPPNSRVLRVAEQPVTSAESAINRLQQALNASSGTVTLDVITPSGPARVYLRADGD